MQFSAKKTAVMAFVSGIIVLVFIMIGSYYKKSADSTYTLKSYRNTVALYDNDELITTFEDIVLNTLPESDIAAFNEGVSIESVDAAQKYLEDYDS